MTDRPAPDAADLPEVDAAFEAASARHDGEVALAEGVTADGPELRIVQAVSARVADVPPAPPGSVDAQVAAALAAFGEPSEAAEPSGARPVTALADRRPWWQRAPLGAAAAVVAVVALFGAIGLAAVSDDDDAADTAATAVAADAESSARLEESEAFDAAGGVAGGTDLTDGEREAYADFDELAAAIAQPSATTTIADGEDTAEASADAAPSVEAAPGGEGAAGCDAVGAAGIDPATVEEVRPVFVDGQLVSAIVHAGEDGRRLTSVDEVTCGVVDDRPL